MSKYAFYLYFVLLFFVVVFENATIGSKLEPAELFFPVLGISCAILFFKRPFSFQFLWLDAVFLFFLLFQLFIAYKNGIQQTRMGWIGHFYFFVLYGTVNWLFFNSTISLERLKNIFYTVTLFLSGLGLLGTLLTHFDVATTLAWDKHFPFPYFNGIGRAMGWSGHPNNLMSIIGISWLFRLSDLFESQRWTKKDVFYFSFTLLVGLLTLSKVLLLYGVGILFLGYSFYPIFLKKQWIWGFAILVFSVYLLATHVGIYETHSPKLQQLVEVGTVAPHPIYLFETEKTGVYLNNYSLLHQAALLYGAEHQPWGIGLGQFAQRNPIFQARQWYTPQMATDLYAPHCIYLGFWVETGVLGLLALQFLFYTYYYTIKKTFSTLIFNSEETRFLTITNIIALIYIVDGFTTDVFFLRYYFIFFVLAIAVGRKKKAEQKEQQRIFT
jgi:hypothetical protein